MSFGSETCRRMREKMKSSSCSSRLLTLLPLQSPCGVDFRKMVLMLSLRKSSRGCCSELADARRFASCAEAKVALGITKLNPYLRGGRLTVTVPRRFFQKDTPSTSGYFDQSLTGKVTDHANRDVTRTTTQQEEKTIGDADPDSTTANGKALYSPQDARSGL